MLFFIFFGITLISCCCVVEVGMNRPFARDYNSVPNELVMHSTKLECEDWKLLFFYDGFLGEFLCLFDLPSWLWEVVFFTWECNGLFLAYLWKDNGWSSSLSSSNFLGKFDLSEASTTIKMCCQWHRLGTKSQNHGTKWRVVSFVNSGLQQPGRDDYEIVKAIEVNKTLWGLWFY